MGGEPTFTTGINAYQQPITRTLHTMATPHRWAVLARCGHAGWRG